MANSTVQARVDPRLKQEAEAVFAAMGMTTAEAIRIFLQQTVNRGGLPFQPTAKTPNADTIQALAELEAQGGHVFDTVDALFDDWDR